MLLCCSANQFIVNEAQNQRLLKDNSEDSVSQDVFASQNPSAPPLYSRMTESAPAGASFEETASHDPYY